MPRDLVEFEAVADRRACLGRAGWRSVPWRPPQHPDTSTPFASYVLFSMIAAQLRRTAKRWLWLMWLPVIAGTASSYETKPTTFASKALPLTTPVAFELHAGVVAQVEAMAHVLDELVGHEGDLARGARVRRAALAGQRLTTPRRRWLRRRAVRLRGSRLFGSQAERPRVLVQLTAVNGGRAPPSTAVRRSRVADGNNQYGVGVRPSQRGRSTTAGDICVYSARTLVEGCSI